MKSDLARVLRTENARKVLYSLCEETLMRDDLSDEIRREIKDIETRTGRLNPAVQHQPTVSRQVAADTKRLDQIIAVVGRPTALPLPRS